MIKSWMLAAGGVGLACAWIGCGGGESDKDQPVGSLDQDAGSDVGKGGSAGAAGAASGRGRESGVKYCTGNTPRACDSNSQWLDGPACTGATPFVLLGTARGTSQGRKHGMAIVEVMVDCVSHL